MNILADAVNHIQAVAPLQKCIIKTYEITNNNGFAQEIIKNEIDTYAHIQPVTPSELKLFTDSTIDSTKCYKFFFVNRQAKIINSVDISIENSYILWNDYTLKVYGIRDWYCINGWVSIYATISNQNLGVQND